MFPEFQQQPGPQRPNPLPFPGPVQSGSQPAWTDVPFEIDGKDVDAAQKIADALRRHSAHEDKTYIHRHAGSTLSWTVQFAKQLYDVRKLFHEAAPDAADAVSMIDIYQDVALHRQLHRVAAVVDSAVPVMRLGNERQIPCLFAPRVIQQITQSDCERYELQVREALDRVFEQKQICFMSRNEADALFISGLESYLVTRIAGGRWPRRNKAERSRRIDRAHIRERAGIGWTGLIRQGVATARGDGQFWEVRTRAAGLVIYWTNEYGVRIPALNIGGKTEPPAPLKVFLRIGNGFIGADAGPNHTALWDESRIKVPSWTPVFTTNQF